jgi:hypothetical protein
MRRTLGWTLILGIALTACRLGRGRPPTPAGDAAVPQTRSQARTAVVAEINQYYSDLSARNWPAFAAHFWPGATITTAWQPPGEARVRVDIQTVDQFVARAPLGPGSKPIFEEKLLSSEIRIQRNLAFVWARYSAAFGDETDLQRWQGTDAFSLLQVDGNWKIVSLTFSGDE